MLPLHAWLRASLVVFCLLLVTLTCTPRAHGADPEVIDLSGAWRFKLAPQKEHGGKGEAKNDWETADVFDDDWEQIQVGQPWEEQGHAYNGIAWYRRRFVIPEAWKGSTLVLQAGYPDDGAETYFNGQSLGEVKFTQCIVAVLPAEKIRWGQTNTVAVRVWDWYKSGGLSRGTFAVRRLAPLTAPTDAPAAATLPLTVTRDLPDDVFTDTSWQPGFRDEGTSDTRPRVAVARKAFRGQDALAMNVWYPNSAEFIDCELPRAQRGSAWATAGYNAISFWYRTGDLAGDMVIKLADGRHRWKQNVTRYRAEFPVQKGDWQQVVIPLSAFRKEGEKENRNEAQWLADPAALDTLALGYDNHRLRQPGTVQLAGFEMLALPTTPLLRGIDLRGAWRIQEDNIRPDGTRSDFGKRGEEEKHAQDRAGYGVELGYHQPTHADQHWPVVMLGEDWRAQGQSLRGPVWLRQQVVIPAAWQGLPLRLRLGEAQETAELYWNGQRIAQTNAAGEALIATIAPEQINLGSVNTIAVRVSSWTRPTSLGDGALDLMPTDARQLLLRHAGQPASAAPIGEFEMGALPSTDLEFVLRLRTEQRPATALRAEYAFVDCFKRQLIAGQTPLRLLPDGQLEAVMPLQTAGSRQLFNAEWFEAIILVRDSKGQVLAGLSWPDDSRRLFTLKYQQRDELVIDPLPAKMEDTPYGQLKLIDVIDCAADPAVGPHPYKEGGIRASWVSTRAYATWKQGVTVEKHQGRSFREANNNEFFGYRVGRGKLQPHRAYLLRVLVPDDKARYCVMDIKAGRNYQGTGYRNGVGPDDPQVNYPHTGQFQWYDHLVINDEMTYGYRGARSTSSENGFWVFFHDNGRNYTGQYEAGPAVAEIRLYEVADVAAHAPVIRYPEGQPRRVLMMDWERQPEAPPVDAALWAQFAGLNAIGPVFQKWSSHGFWHSSLGFAPPGWYRASPEGEDDRDVYGKWLQGTRQVDMGFIPRVEYGGSNTLPSEARIIGTNGKVDKCGRYSAWGANILHPAVWREMDTLIDEIIGREIKANPQIRGLLWRQRQDRIKCSYGKQDVALFCSETGQTMPAGDDAALAKWASTTVKDQYHAWWQLKRAAFLRQVRDRLQAIRPDLKLYYYNWDEDGWNLGPSMNAGNSSQDWSDLYNVDRAGDFWKRRLARLAQFTPQDFVQQVSSFGAIHRNVMPELYAQDRGIVLFAPVHWRYLADNAPYLNYFRTGDGLAMCNMFYYEEKARWNVQGDNYEASEMTPGGWDYGNAEEVLACFHGDPNVITRTTYTYGWGWLDRWRQFAAAFLALPDMTGQVIDNAVAPASADVRVRVYPTSSGTYVGVVHRGTQAGKFTISVPAAGATVVDQVTGQTIPAQRSGERMTFAVEMTPMQLQSFVIR